MKEINRAMFSDAGKKGQATLRKKLGEDKYIARLGKIGKKGGKNKKQKEPVDKSLDK